MNILKTLLFFLVSALIVISGADAQEKYQFDFKIKGLKDTTIYLGYYFGESTYLKDTAEVNSIGMFSFSGTEQLPRGVYFLVLNKNRLFDFLVGNKQAFSLESDLNGSVTDIKVQGNKENELFFEHIRFIVERNKEAEPYFAIINDSTITDKKNARKEIDRIDKQVKDYQADVISKVPNSLLAKTLLAQKEVEVPESTGATEAERKSAALSFYKAHFWDYFELDDDALLRQPHPVYRKKVESYLNNLFVQDPDTLIKAIDFLVEKSRSNEETYKYLVWNLVLNYQQPKIMGLDKVFIHLYEKYFASGEMDFWANDNLKKNLKERSDQLSKSLLGSKAQNLIIQNLEGKQESLYDIGTKYTVIYFYDPDCGFCKKETPKLKDFFDSTRFDVSIYAVNADTSLTKMRNYIEDMELDKWIHVNGPRAYTEHYKKLYDAQTTPTIYVLNEEKKIIAKKLNAARLEEFLENYEKMRNKNGGQ